MADPTTTPTTAPPSIPTPDPTAIQANSVLFYNNGIFATRGYATPYLAPDHLTTCNRDIKDLCDTFARLLSGIMQMPDVWVAAAPTRTFLQTVGKSIDRFRTIIASRMVPDGQLDNRTVALQPAQEPFLIYPVPYFYVRSSWAKRWAWGAMMALGEGMKSHDNVFPLGIHATLAGIMSMYTEQIYREIAVELLGKPAPVPATPGAPIAPTPTLLDADYASYSAPSVFTQIERIDQGAPLNWQLPSEMLTTIAGGIPATQIYSQLSNPPGSVVNSILGGGVGGTVSAGAAPAVSAGPTVPPPPSP